MTHGSLFSGIGGFDLAAQWMEWQNIFHCEINPFCQKILNNYWPNADSYTDIKQTDFSIYRGKIDVLSGGFPCQPFSTAGRRKGAEDDRYLWPEMLRAIDEIRPTWVIGENVAGLASMVQPEAYKTNVESQINIQGEVDQETVLEYQQYVTETVCSDLEHLGYSVQPIIIPACATGAPHRRDRIWFIAHCTNTRIESMREQKNCIYGSDSIANSNSIRSEGWASNSEREDQNQAIGSNLHEQISRSRIQRTSSYTSGDRRIWQRPGPENEDRQQESEYSGVMEGRPEGLCVQKYATYSQFKGLEGRFINEKPNRRERSEVRRDGPGFCEESNWTEFPTQSPVCGGDDGLPTKLDGITFPRWRSESIKSYGNAVVPQVVFEIFKAIESI